MNNLKKLLPLVLTLVVLAACGAKEKMDAEVDTTVQVQPTVNEVAEGAVSEETNVSRYGTGLNCGVLQRAESKERCEVQINDVIGMMLEEEIRDSFDAKRCQKLPDDLAESCVNDIAKTGVQGPITDEERMVFEEALLPSYPAIDEEGGEDASARPVYDKAKCAELKTPGYKEHCEKAVADRMDREKLDEIVDSGNVSRCEELVTESVRNDCKSYFGIESPEPEPVEEPGSAPDEV